ncbi:MAG: hypothetical protein WD751_11775 [Anaerolineales bacterium]
MVAQQKDRERLGILDRWLDLIFSILGMLLVLGFFMAHQLSNTGFFTAEFGPTEMLALYGPMALAVVPAVIRSSLGLRNPGRPMEVIANAALAAGSLWLFFVFPFDFSHLPDVLPAGVQFLFGWITDGLARIVLILQVVIGTLTAVGKMWKFVAVQGR